MASLWSHPWIIVNLIHVMGTLNDHVKASFTLRNVARGIKPNALPAFKMELILTYITVC